MPMTIFSKGLVSAVNAAGIFLTQPLLVWGAERRWLLQRPSQTAPLCLT